MPDPGYDKKKFTKIIDDFTGGVNSYFPSNEIGNNFMTSAQNCLVNEDGVLTRRPGIEAVGVIEVDLNTEGTGDIGDILVAGEGSTKKIWVSGHGKTGSTDKLFYRTWDGTAPWDEKDIDHPAEGAGKERGDSSFVRESTSTEEDPNEYVWFTNPGDDKVRKATITPVGGAPVFSEAATSPTDPPLNARFLVNHINHLWMGGIDGIDRNILFYSAYAGGIPGIGVELWDQSLNTIVFHTDDGQAITGIAPFRDNMLLVGLERSLFVVHVGTGNATLDWQSQSISLDIGIGSHKTLASVGEDLLFMDQYGEIRSLRTTMSETAALTKSQAISIAIRDEIQDMDPSYIYKSSAAYRNGYYWLSFQGKNNNWRCFVFNVVTKKWFGPMIFKDGEGKALQIKAMTSASGDPGITGVDSRNTHLYFFTDNNDSNDVGTDSERFQVYDLKESLFKDDGETAIDMEAITKAMDFGFPHELKILEWLEISFKQVTGTTGLFTIECRADYGDWADVAKIDYTTGAEVQWKKVSLEHLGRGRVFQFRIKCSDLNTNPKITRFVIRGRGFTAKRAG